MTKNEVVETVKKMGNARIINMWNEYVGEKSFPHITVYPNNCAVFNSFFTPYDAVLASYMVITMKMMPM